MKKLLLIFVFSLYVVEGYSQGAQIVNDPTNTVINLAIKTLQQGSQKLQTFVAQAEKLKLATEGLDQLQSIKQIMQLTDELACLTSELQVNMSVGKNYSCATYLNYKLMSFNLSYSTDIIQKVLLSKNIFTMPASERLNILENIRKTLETTIEELQALNNSFASLSQKKLLNSYVKKNYHSANSINFNRYNQ